MSVAFRIERFLTVEDVEETNRYCVSRVSSSVSDFDGFVISWLNGEYNNDEKQLEKAFYSPVRLNVNVMGVALALDQDYRGCILSIAELNFLITDAFLA